MPLRALLTPACDPGVPGNGVGGGRALAVGCCGAGLSLESLLTNKRCKCVKVTAQIISLGLILAIDVMPPGIHCRRKEIM